MIINHNIAALNTHRQLSSASSSQSKSMEKLASGLRINKAGDDAAGLAISEKMRGQIRGLDQAAKNGQDGISLIQTAEGALNETHSILQRMRELAVQGSNDTATQKDRGEIQKEVDQLAQEITRISNTSEFNTKNLLAGGHNSTFQIGANADQNLKLSINAMDAFSLGVTSNVAGAISVNSDTAGITAATVTSGSVASSTTGNVAITSQVNETNATLTGSVNLTGSETLESLGFENGDVIELSVVNNAGAPGTVSFAVADKTQTTTQFAAALTSEFATDGSSGTAAITDGKLTIQGSGTGDDSTITLAAGSSDKFQTAFGITEGVASTGTTTLSFTASQGSLSSSVSGVAKDATSVNFTAGDFAGLSLTKNAGDVDGGASVLSIATGTASSAATVGGDGSVTTNASVASGISVMTQGRANNAITVINNAIETVSAERSKLGAVQNRLDHTINNLNTSSENLTAAESRIRDVDYTLAA